MVAGLEDDMERLTGADAKNGLAAFGAAVATIAAAAVAAVLAVVFAATVVVIGFMATLLIGLTGLAFRARRSVRHAAAPADANLIEARRIGGHSWVAYGWDRRDH
jgi:hypothetical protein